MDRIKMIDTHHHLWDLKHLNYPWLTNEIDPHFPWGDYASIRKNYLPADFFRDRASQDVVMSVHVEAECARNQQVTETAWLSEMHKQHGCPNAIIGHVWLDRLDTEEILLGHMQYPLFRGVRSKPRTASSPKAAPVEGPGTMKDPKWRAGLALLVKHRLVYDFRVPAWHLAEGAELARAFPELQIILNHAGLPRDRSAEGLAFWRPMMKEIAAAPNVAVKISGLGMPDEKWTDDSQRRVVLETIELFGVDRCMFGSNFPVDRCIADYDTIMGGFRRIVAHLPVADQQKLLHDNAMKFYRPVA